MFSRDIFRELHDNAMRQGAVVLAGVLGTLAATVIIAGEAGYDMDALSDEQKILANRMIEFASDTETKFFGFVARVDGDVEVEERVFEYEHGDYDIKVVRGDVIEKAGFTNSVTKAGVKPFTQPSTWSRIVQVNIHPKSPLAGYLHGFVAFSYDADGKSSVGGWMDFIPGVVIEEDIAGVRQALDRVFEAHGVDQKPYRKAVCGGNRVVVLQHSCAGVSFYAPPFYDVTEKNFDVVTDTFTALFDAFIAIVERRMDQEFDTTDVAAQEAMRRRWIYDQNIRDPYAQNVIPYEVRSFQNYPPTVRY